MAEKAPNERTTIPALRKMKRDGRRITMLTAYDASFARLLDGIADVLLVGDSLGMVIQGADDTLSVTVEEVIYHTRAVARGARQAQLVADMPFLSYQVSIEEGLKNAGRMLKEGHAQAVKLEGCHPELIERLTRVGIPVMGHLGLTPQSVHAVGGYKVQGRRRAQAEQLVEDAKTLEQAGVYSLVLEAVPLDLARQVTEALKVPTIGIGAGPYCDGQVLVIYDLLGMDDTFCPRFLKRYDSFAERVRAAASRYAEEVREGSFPTREHSFEGRSNRATARAEGQLKLYSGAKS